MSELPNNNVPLLYNGLNQYGSFIGQEPKIFYTSNGNNERPRCVFNKDNNKRSPNKRPRFVFNKDNNKRPPNKRPRNTSTRTNRNYRTPTNNTNRSIIKSNTPQNDLLPLLWLLGNLDDFDGFGDTYGLSTLKDPVQPPYICPGKYCDHDPESKNIPIIPKRLYNCSADYKITLTDLVELGECFHCKLQKNFFTISLERLAKLNEPLHKLKTMIGMKIIKESFAEQIVYFLLDLEPNPTEILHTILEGGPGVGKSLIVDILAEIYLKMGYLTKNIVKKVKLNDLKGKYVGHTVAMTQKAIDDAIGGVLIIDEAYSLGSAGKLDVFSKELIDTLNRNLTENAGKFVCIVAGYGDQLEKCFFAHNPGLRSRFRFRFIIDSYSSDELAAIFNLKVKNDKWDFHPDFNFNEQLIFFKNHYKNFKYYGRDIETLLYHTKVAHSNRIFFQPEDVIKKLTMNDIKMGFQRFILHNKDESNDIPSFFAHMYA